MKRIGNLYQRILTFSNLKKALIKSLKNKKRTLEMKKFWYNQETEFVILQRELNYKTYHPKPYYLFSIFDPKFRVICSADFRDRVVHHATSNIIEPYIDRMLIYDTYACRKEKGSHKARSRAKKFCQKYPFYFKTDIRKYFDSIPHASLKECLSCYFKDSDLLWLCDKIISSYSVSPEKGIPLGNLTSQLFANLYLNDLDHLIKDHLQIPAYIRYMDDMVLWAESKEILHEAEFAIIECLKAKGLELKTSATMLRHSYEGLPFLGFRIFPDKMKIKKENWKRFVQKFWLRHKEFLAGKKNLSSFQTSIASMIGHVASGNTKKLLNQFFNNFSKKFKANYQESWQDFCLKNIPKYFKRCITKILSIK